MCIRLSLLLAIVIGAGLVAGCRKPDEIEHYRQPKSEKLQEKYFGEVAPEFLPYHPPDRMFAAIVPHQGQFWFFKLVGPTEPVFDQRTAFLSLVESVRFAGDDSPPQWTLPNGWHELPRTKASPTQRFATIQIGSGDKPLEVTVASLPRDAHGDDSKALLMNVNRWRAQMGHGMIGPALLDSTIRRRKFDGKFASGAPYYVLGLSGTYQTGGMSPPAAEGGDQAALPAGHPACLQAIRRCRRAIRRSIRARRPTAHRRLPARPRPAAN